MRKKNVGRISALILILNILFFSVYITEAEKKKEEDKKTYMELTVFRDEGVNPLYARWLLDEMGQQDLTKEEAELLKEKSWYVTSDEGKTKNYLISKEEVFLYAGDKEKFLENLRTTVYIILSEKGLRSDG